MAKPKEAKKELRCARCGHAWVPRAGPPKSCPRCKRYDWKEK